MPPKKKNLRSLSVYPEAPILSKPAYQGELERPVGEGVKIRPAKRDITQLAQTSDPVVVMLSFAGMRWQNFDKYTESLYAVTIALRSVQASGVASHSLLSPGTMDASTPCFSSRHRQLGLPKSSRIGKPRLWTRLWQKALAIGRYTSTSCAIQDASP